MEILTKPNDDPQFVELVSHVISSCINDSAPEEIFVMKIDNWFDHKWLNFSGKGRVGFFWSLHPSDPDTALDAFHQDKITFPPFTPKRVIEEYYFLRDEGGVYSPSTRAPYIHERKLAPSSKNLHRRVADFAGSAIFIWFSSNTKSNGRGSIMVYEARGSRVHTWYVAFSKDEEWRVVQTRGITREQVQSFMERDVTQGRT